MDHSPGPWRLVKDTAFITDAQDQVTAKIPQPLDMSFDRWRANRALVAAAPDLLAAARAVLAGQEGAIEQLKAAVEAAERTET